MRVNFQRWMIGLFMALALTAQACADWDKLGERRVSDRADHDTVMVTAARGMFGALKFNVKDHAVRFYKVVVHYRKGGSEEMQLRDVIPAGGESRVLDLRGERRVIKSIEFWYEAKSLGQDGATITVWGRR